MRLSSRVREVADDRSSAVASIVEMLQAKLTPIIHLRQTVVSWEFFVLFQNLPHKGVS